MSREHYLMGSAVVKRLAWSSVNQLNSLLKLLWLNLGKVGLLRKELPQETVGMFV